jgi:hypothetical protein
MRWFQRRRRIREDLPRLAAVDKTVAHVGAAVRPAPRGRVVPESTRHPLDSRSDRRSADPCRAGPAPVCHGAGAHHPQRPPRLR